MELTYLKVFVDYLDAIEPLSDAERGRLFTALLEYGRTGVAPQLGGNERFLFPMMKAQIDRDKATMEAESSTFSEAGKKGAKARWQGYKKDSLDSQAKPGYKNDGLDGKEEDKDKEEDKEEDKDKNIPPKSPQGDLFERFWAAYPKKKSKGQARKAWDKLHVDSTMLATILQAVERAKQSEDWQKDGGQYIPYPATWLNAEGWEDEEPGPDPPPDRPPVKMHWVVPNPDSDNWEDLVP